MKNCVSDWEKQVVIMRGVFLLLREWYFFSDSLVFVNFFCEPLKFGNIMRKSFRGMPIKIVNVLTQNYEVLRENPCPYLLKA